MIITKLLRESVFHVVRCTIITCATVKNRKSTLWILPHSVNWYARCSLVFALEDWALEATPNTIIMAFASNPRRPWINSLMINCIRLFAITLMRITNKSKFQRELLHFHESVIFDIYIYFVLLLYSFEIYTCETFFVKIFSWRLVFEFCLLKQICLDWRLSLRSVFVLLILTIFVIQTKENKVESYSFTEINLICRSFW